MGKHRVWLFGILVFLFICLNACNSGGDPGNNNSGQFDEKTVIKEAQKSLTLFSDNLAGGKVEKVLEMLDASARDQVGDQLDLSSPETQKLATAISAAKVQEAFNGIVYFSTVIDGEIVSFYMIKEAGTWKFGGL